MKIYELFGKRHFLVVHIIILLVLPVTLVLSTIFFISQVEPFGIKIVGGTLTEDTTWEGHISVQQNIIVPEGITLTVLPDTFIEFKHFRGYKNISRVGLFIDGGKISAIGTPDQQIWFTSDAEDPINGDWSGIVCENSNNSIFKYVIVEFSIVGIEFLESNISLSHSIIRWIHTEGIYSSRSYGKIASNLLYGNGYHEIALEEFNYNVTIENNIFNGGHFGMLAEASNSLVRWNYFVNYSGNAIMVTSISNISIIGNRFENIGMGPISIDTTAKAYKFGNDLSGNGSMPIPILDFPDPKPRELGYVPGDPEDRYSYVYDTIDETRKIINRLENETSFDWSLAYVNGSLWKFKHKSTDIGDAKNFVKINATSESIIEYGNNDILNPNGLAYDGQYFWTYDIVYKTIIKFKINNSDYVEVVDKYPLPSQIGNSAGIATDGTYLYLPGSDGTRLYKLDKTTNIIEIITLSGGTIFGTLTWTGSHFWVASETELTKWNINGTLIGKIYPVAEGTIGITWDGNYLWTSQKTCEVWNDGKIFQIEILNDQILLA